MKICGGILFVCSDEERFDAGPIKQLPRWKINGRCELGEERLWRIGKFLCKQDASFFKLCQKTGYKAKQSKFTVYRHHILKFA